MESCGMILAFPVTAIASVSYVLFVSFLAPLWPKVRRALFASSFVVLSAALLEFIVISKWGLLGARGHFGPRFELLHDVVFYLTPPAVANILLLGRRHPSRKWFVPALVALATFAVAITFVFWNIDVSETLYGVDGVGGPFAR